MLKYAALGVLVRLALWLSPMQGYFASSMQCATPLTSAARRASVALHSTALCDLCRPQCSSAQLRGLSARRSRNSVRYRAFVALSYLAGVMSARYTLPVDEGAFWVESGQSPYAEDARIVYQPPFIVFMQSALRSMPSPGGDGFWSTVALSLADIIAAAALRQLASPAKETLLATARPGRSTTVAIAYLFNPQIVAACVAGSTVAYSNAATLLSLSLATRGRGAAAASMLGVATYLSVYPAMLLLPVMLLSMESTASATAQSDDGAASGRRVVAVVFGAFAAVLSVLMWVSHLALGSSWDFVGVCYGTLLLLSDLTPTIGPWQPVFVALFPRYRSLFLVAVHGHAISYLIPLGLRFRENALYMASLIVLLTSLLKTYPCAADIGLGLSLLSVHDKVTAEMRHKWFIAMLFGWSHVQTEFALDAWLMQGSGNSNYYYFSSLLGLIAQVGTITTAFNGALALEDRLAKRRKAE